MGELQALVTGVVMGTLHSQPYIAVDVEPVTDADGFLPEVLVTGRNSGERLRIVIEALPAEDFANLGAC